MGSLGKDGNGSCLWAAASCQIMPSTLPPQPPLQVLLLASFFLSFWDCHSIPSHIFCASPQKRLHIQVWATSKPNSCELSSFFKQPSSSLPNPALSCMTLQEILASSPTACSKAGRAAASNRRPPLPSFSSPSLWAWRKEKYYPTDSGFADAKKQMEERAYPMPTSGSLQKVSASARIRPLDAAGS